MNSFLVNWKTTAGGVVTVVIGVLSLLGVKVVGSAPIDPQVAVTMITGGLALIFAKDAHPPTIAKVLLVAAAASLFLVPRADAADIATKAAPALSYNYPTTKCGLYYGINTMGSTGSVDGAAVGTQVVQGDIGLTLGYTCPAGAGYWFLDASADFANLNGSQNGLALSGPAQFMERFGFGAPVNEIIAMVPGLANLQNAVPSLIPLPAGVAVVTSNPYLFGGLHETDVSLANGLGANREWLISAGFGIGNKTRLSNGVVFDPFVEYVLPSTKLCIGPVAGQCYQQGNQVNVGMILEF